MQITLTGQHLCFMAARSHSQPHILLSAGELQHCQPSLSRAINLRVHRSPLRLPAVHSTMPGIAQWDHCSQAWPLVEKPPVLSLELKRRPDSLFVTRKHGLSAWLQQEPIRRKTEMGKSCLCKQTGAHRQPGACQSLRTRSFLQRSE